MALGVNLLIKAKRLAEGVPEPLSRHFSAVPYSWRLGSAYGASASLLRRVNGLSPDARATAIVSMLQRIVTHAYDQVPFYRELYDSRGFHPARLQNLEDFETVPIVTKADLQNVPVEARSVAERGRYRFNTGGTSGQPLEFYLDRNGFAREWAHMHSIWARLGYDRRHLKLTFRGKNLGTAPLRFNPVHNEYYVNTYLDHRLVVEAVRELVQRRTVAFIHGYPSAIYEFARHCTDSAPDLVKVLNRSLRGVLLGSEYPAPTYRETIEDTFQVPSLSWYGHSEMAILAYEEQKYVYRPLYSYGFAEAVPAPDGQYRLVSTSYWNTASPFIRYDTGDLIAPEREGLLLKSFSITAGRTGDFILDRKGQRISLTALIFGRHHNAFAWARFVQVKQTAPGEATIVVSGGRPPGADDSSVLRDFDLTHVDVSFGAELRAEPHRTPSGKIPLLVRD